MMNTPATIWDKVFTIQLCSCFVFTTGIGYYVRGVFFGCYSGVKIFNNVRVQHCGYMHLYTVCKLETRTRRIRLLGLTRF